MAPSLGQALLRNRQARGLDDLGLLYKFLTENILWTRHCVLIQHCGDTELGEQVRFLPPGAYSLVGE